MTSLGKIVTPAIAQSVAELDFSLAEWDRNPRIARLLSRTVLRGGKRLRPLITFMVADLLDVPHASIGPLARMVELVHASTLAHDDVVDNAQIRRGLPSINSVASNKQAVLAGDYLLSFVLQEIAATGRNDLVIEMARIIADLAEGEWLQIENASKRDLTWVDIEAVAFHKTASVLRWSFVAPAMMANMDAGFLQKCRRLGEAIGIAFQLTDDILDFKRVDGAENADMKNRVINAVIFEALSLKHNASALDMTWETDLDVASTLEEAIRLVRSRVDRLVTESKRLLFEIADLYEQERGYRSETSLEKLVTMIDFLAQRI
jgi:geranylgeranyl pyrophosphate synthase